MKRYIYIITCLFVLFCFVQSVDANPKPGEIGGRIKAYTSYGREVFDMGYIPIQEAAEAGIWARLTHYPLKFGQFGIKYHASGLLYNDFNPEKTDSFEQSVMLDWRKYWGGTFGKLRTTLNWQAKSFYEKDLDWAQSVGGSIGLEVLGHPRIEFTYEYDTYDYIESRITAHQFLPTYRENIEFYIGGYINYIAFNTVYSPLVTIYIDNNGNQTVIDNTGKTPYSGLHSYNATLGISWKFGTNDNWELFPAINLLGALTSEASDEMNRLGDSDFLWTPSINLYYNW